MLPWGSAEKRSRKAWEATIGDEASAVTLDELAASELLHVCARLERIEEALRYVVLNAAAIDGRLSRIEVYLRAHDPGYPSDDDQKQRLAKAVLARDGTDALATIAARTDGEQAR